MENLRITVVVPSRNVGTASVAEQLLLQRRSICIGYGGGGEAAYVLQMTVIRLQKNIHVRKVV